MIVVPVVAVMPMKPMVTMVLMSPMIFMASVVPIDMAMVMMLVCCVGY